jgi:hypothetical protein
MKLLDATSIKENITVFHIKYLFHIRSLYSMLFGAKMVLCALAGLSGSLRSAANLPAAAHKT